MDQPGSVLHLLPRMKDNVYQEYRNHHASNRSGVRATCPDCHVPRWAEMIRKIRASNEVLRRVASHRHAAEKSAWRLGWPSMNGSG